MKSKIKYVIQSFPSVDFFFPCTLKNTHFRDWGDQFYECTLLRETSESRVHPFCFHSWTLNSLNVTCHSLDEIQIVFGKKKWANERNHIHTSHFFLRQVTCNSFRHTIILLKGIPVILKYINIIVDTIIQGKGIITPALQCSPAYLHMYKDTSQKDYSHSAIPYEASVTQLCWKG